MRVQIGTPAIDEQDLGNQRRVVITSSDGRFDLQIIEDKGAFHIHSATCLLAVKPIARNAVVIADDRKDHQS